MKYRNTVHERILGLIFAICAGISSPVAKVASIQTQGHKRHSVRNGMVHRFHLNRLCMILLLVTIPIISTTFISTPPVHAVSTGTWTLRIPPDAPAERGHHAMAYDSARNVTVMFGGLRAGGEVLNETWELSGNKWLRRTPAHAPSARYSHAMAYDEARRQVVLFGGSSGADQTWIWDGNDWTLKTPATNPPALYAPQLAYDRAREVVVMFGGQTSGGYCYNGTWEWDGSNWTERHPQNAPEGRFAFPMAYDAARNRIVLLGGWGTNDNQTWEYDGSNWVNYDPAIAPPAPPSDNIVMAYDETIHRTVLLTGDPTNTNAIVNRVWEWDGTNWTERTPTDPTDGPSIRSATAFVYDSVRARTILFGGGSGQTDNSKELKDTWERDGASGTWTETVAPRNPSGVGPAVYDIARGEIVRFGGSTATSGPPSATNETWVLGDNDTRWTRKFPQHSPPGRLNHVMLYDSRRSVTMLFGGISNYWGIPLNDAWEWDGTDWIQKPPASSPPAGILAITYDSDRGVTVMLGLQNNTRETWEYDGTNWVQRFPQHSPGLSGSMVYDSFRHKAVLFAGNYGLSPSNETWEWDGTDWTQRTLPQSPSPRCAVGMVFDAGRGVTVLYGGINPGWGPSDTWEYDGNTWTYINTTVSPGPRYTNLVYDVNRHAVDMVGGGGPGGIIDDTWEYQGPPTNTTPVVSANQSSVSTDEGQAATNIGTYSDSNVGDDVAITSSIGTITKTGTNNGTWSWSYTTTDGPAQSQPITITANDGNGGIAATLFSLTVNNIAPTVDAGPDQTADEGEAVYFSGVFTDPGVLDTHTIVWDFGDGATANGTLNPTHTYADGGIFTVTLTVTDDDGGVGSDVLAVVVQVLPTPTPTPTPPQVLTLYLHGSGATANPPTLFLDANAPTSATARYKDSASIKFSGGNAWREVGTWAAAPGLTGGELTTLNDLHVWLGLKNSDDIGTRFDLRAEVYRNGELITAGETYCITNVTRNPDQAREVIVPPATFAPVTMNGTSDTLSLRVLVRIGTDGAGAMCGGHSNAVGVRLYFDAASRPAQFGATLATGSP